MHLPHYKSPTALFDYASPYLWNDDLLSSFRQSHPVHSFPVWFIPSCTHWLVTTLVYILTHSLLLHT